VGRARLRLRSQSPEATHALARGLASVLLEEGLLIALRGPLGAGKTGFVKGLAEGLGVDPGIVASPTFVIAHEYPAGTLPSGAARRLVHVDLYRLERAAELDAAGFLDALGGACVVAVEWADRFPESLPQDHLEVALERPAGEAGERVRIIRAEARGLAAESVLRRWRLCFGVAGCTAEDAEEDGPCP